MAKWRNGLRQGALALTSVLAVGACGDDDKTVANVDGGGPSALVDAGGTGSLPTAPGDAGAPSQGDGSVAPPTPGIDSGLATGPTPDAGPAADPVYLYQIAVYGPDETLQYDVLRRTVDFNITVDDLKKAREFPGYTGIASIGGHVIAGDSESPFATKYKIGADLSWTQVGEKLNFGDYFMDDTDGLNFYFQSIRGKDMYFFYGSDRTSRLHWDVEAWKIIAPHEDTKLPLAANGLTLGNMGNRTGVRDFVGPVVWPFTMTNEDGNKFSDKSWLGVYDPTTHVEKGVIEVPCPGIQQSTKDESGNLYFSTTGYDPTAALYGDAPASCVVKVKPDGTLDTTFPANDLKAWTGSYGVNFRYLAKGKAVANIVHPERLIGVDFNGAYDPDVQCKVWSCELKPDAADPKLWDIHVIDIATGTSKIVTGFAPEHDVGWYSIYHELDGRWFVAVQVELETTNNVLYELNLDTATVTRAGQVAGDIFGVSRVR